MKSINKKYSHLGAYGIIIENNNNILLIKKNGGPYDGKLDLPGGTIEFGEKPNETIVRELLEEVGIRIKNFELFNIDSVSFTWKYKNENIDVHHICVFYKINEYDGTIAKNMKISEVNNDSHGADFYDISKLNKKDLSEITILLLQSLGYFIEDK